MKYCLSFIFTCVALLHSYAGITTYTFTSKDWKSQVNATTCDGKTDGWVCDQEAYEYSDGRTDAQNRIYSRGVSVKTSTSNAGATSVVTFEEVRGIDINFCQNASKGKGSIFVQVGENTPHELVINRPQKNMGQYNRDTTLQIATAETGKIRFWVTCTENSININTLSIRSNNGGSSPFTTDTYQLVTDISQLQDSDQIIIGVQDPTVNNIMGYFDEAVSSNNIHAIRGKYSEDRMQVAADDNAIYTLHKTELNGEVAFYIEDNVRYECAYLVANGGQTKNKLALWDKLYDSKTYGNYGYWNINIAQNGEATIMNLGNSKGKYLQYNASNNPPLFGCYAELSQTPVCIYRRVEALGDTMAIVAPLTNFGTVLLRSGEASGSQTIQVNANRLTEDISVVLKHGAPFHLSTTTIDRDGGNLTISYQATEAGNFVDTLVFSSGDITCQAPVMLRAIAPATVSQAVQSADFETVYLDSVVVTKKFDSYIFVRDHTGSMLIYDTGDGAGKRYGAGLANGHVLRQVVGRFRNYYGVPEISPTQAWNVETNKITCLPEEITTIVDSADVCRYVRLTDVVIDEQNIATAPQINPVTVVDAFNTGIITTLTTQLDAIVMWSWNALELWCVSQEVTEETGTDNITTNNNPTIRKAIIDNQLVIYIDNDLYSILGTKL
ncbi:MAG: hypothetical protein J6S09_05910 [Paludibacteraceae bacterium]|nr:hypothetical protein [Paludibacteraceae bacterium]